MNDENIIVDRTIGFKKSVTNNGNVSSEASTKSHFIGVDFGLFVVGGFRIKIGFNIGG